MFVTEKKFHAALETMRQGFVYEINKLRDELKTAPPIAAAKSVTSTEDPRFGSLPFRKQREILEAKYAVKPPQKNPVEQFDAAKENGIVHSQER